jgi:hypothetical protein
MYREAGRAGPRATHGGRRQFLLLFARPSHREESPGESRDEQLIEVLSGKQDPTLHALCNIRCACIEAPRWLLCKTVASIRPR